MLHIKTITGALALMHINAGITMAAPLLDEPFQYSTGSLVPNGGWTRFSGTEGQVDVVNDGSLTLPAPYPQRTDTGAINLTFSESEDVAVGFTGAATVSSGSVYSGMLVRMTAIPGTGGAYLAMFKPDSANTFDFYGRLWVKAIDASTYQFGISAASADSSSNPGVVPIYETTARNLNETYHVVIKYEYVAGDSNDVASIFINPTPGTPEPATPSATHTNSGVSDSTSIGSFALRQASGVGTMLLDDLRVGTTFADVAPADASVQEWTLY